MSLPKKTLIHMEASGIAKYVKVLILGLMLKNALKAIQARAKKTHCKYGHPYTEENIYVYKSGRSCKACRDIEYQEKQARKILRPKPPKKHFSKAEWETLKRHYNHQCLCCGQSGVRLNADHIIPIAKGGVSTIDNIQPLCEPCNSKKRAQTIDYRPRTQVI